MNREPKVTASAHVLDVADDRVDRLKKAFLSSKYRKELSKPGFISYEVTLEGICRNILLANYSDQPEYSHELFRELNELNKAALRFALDESRLNSIPDTLKEAVFLLTEIDPLKLSAAPKKPGRPKTSKSVRVAKVVLVQYRRLFPQAKASHSTNGDFVNLLDGIFKVLNIQASAENAARMAIGDLEKKPPKSGEFSPPD